MTVRAPDLLAVEVCGRPLAIECRWIGGSDPAAHLLVFLHEGLGSVTSWRDYPQDLCRAGGWRGLLYSRPGYGRSTPRSAGEHWAPTFMHEQAAKVLPAVLAGLDIDTTARPPWLFGHSDGASIALIHAALFPDRVAGLILLAPHIFVEDISIASIRQARTAYASTDLRTKLARHHADPDSAFYGWNDIWLDPAFGDWNIENLLPRVRCPVLAVQGIDDQYGTMAQIEGIGRHVGRAQLLKLGACDHAPHRDQPKRLTQAVVDFIWRQPTDAASSQETAGHTPGNS